VAFALHQKNRIFALTAEAETAKGESWIKRKPKRLMELEVEGLTGAAYGERSPERMNQRNGYRDRLWETRAGTVELRIPKLNCRK
jgi:transposase-like protein